MEYVSFVATSLITKLFAIVALQDTTILQYLKNFYTNIIRLTNFIQDFNVKNWFRVVNEYSFILLIDDLHFFEQVTVTLETVNIKDIDFNEDLLKHNGHHVFASVEPRDHLSDYPVYCLHLHPRARFAEHRWVDLLTGKP